MVKTPFRSGLGWGVVLLAGCVLGGWLSHSRLRSGGGGLLPHPPAQLLIRTSPEGPFKLEVSQTADGTPFEVFDGAYVAELDPGDHFINVVPASSSYQRKRLKVHLSEGQVLALPVVLNRVEPVPIPPPPVEPAPVEPTQPNDPPTSIGLIEGHSDPGDILGGHRADLDPLRDPPIRGRVADLAPMIDGAGVDREVLIRYIRSRKRALQSCYERQLRVTPELQGKLVVRFEITRMGRASGVDIEENTTGDELLSSCVKALIRSWLFPFKPDEVAQVVYPFLFAPVKAEPPPKGARIIY